MIGRRVVTPLDRLLSSTRWAPGRLVLGHALCHLTTVGRHSGEARVTPLLHVPAEDGGIVVVATNWGSRHHPGWSHNIEAEPRVRYRVGSEAVDAVARRIWGDEYEHYFERFIAAWPNYRVYRERRDRAIRMYVLEPTA